jgi:opacity protein-like surface antigen
MKKLVMVLAAALVAVTAFAQVPAIKFSVLGGALLQWDISKMEADGYVDSLIKNNAVGGGALIAFDATFIEASMSLYGEKVTTEYKYGSSSTTDDDTTRTRWGLSLLGKYPFTIAKNVSVFPALGIEWDILLGAKYKGDEVNFNGKYDKEDYNEFWFKLGGGIDFSLTNKIFVRGVFLYGFRPRTNVEEDTKDLYDVGSTKVTTVQHGPGFKLAIGYRL